MVEAPAASWEVALVAAAPLRGVVAVAPGAGPGLHAQLLSAGADVGLLWDLAGPLPTATADPSLVILAAAHGTTGFEIRRSATMARGQWPRARIVLRGPWPADDLAGYVDDPEDRHEMATGTWDELLRFVPVVGEARTLAVGAGDLAGLLRRLAELRARGPAPWIRTRADATVVELLAGNGVRLVAQATGTDLQVLPDAVVLQAEEVVAGAWPTASELLARYQATVVRRERDWPRLRAHGDHVAVFQVPGWSSPVTLTAHVTLEDDAGRRRLAHRDLRLNGLRMGRVPRLPLLAGPTDGPAPLALLVDEAFAYRVDGPAGVDGVACWRLDFAPRAGVARPSGRAFLDRATGELVRLESFASGRDGPFAARRQVDHLTPVQIGEVTARLVTRIETDEVYDAAGHRTPVRRVTRLERYEVVAEGAAPLTGTVVVDLPPAASLAPTPSVTASRSERPRVRTVAAGVLVDPGIDAPLPFVGGSWSELDLLGTGTQLQVVLGGAFARLSWTRPRPAWHLRLDAAAALVTFNDREFRDGREVFDENLAQKPARAALLLGRRLGRSARLQVGYEIARTRLAPNDETALDFAVPLSPLVHGIRGEVDGEAGPWSLRVTLQAARRTRWAAWGRPGARPALRRDFARGGALVSRVLVARPRVQARFEMEAAAGWHLDRFSRFGFDALENRLQGYPTAALRHDGAVVARAVASATVSPRLRVSAFADVARVWASSALAGRDVHGGAGGSVETSLGGVVVAGEWAHGFAAPRPHGGTGADVLRLTAFLAF